MIKAMLFDFDGTILDTEFCDYLAWQTVFRTYGVELPLTEWAAGFHGARASFDPPVELAQRLGRPVHPRTLRHQHQFHETECIQTQLIRPGIRQYLAEAARLNIKLAIVSSDVRAWIVGHLTRFGLTEYFEVICTADDNRPLKPAPDLYQAALQQLAVPAAQAVAFEDSPNGIRSAKAAGIFCVATPNPVTRLLDLSSADLRVDSLAELPLEQLEKLIRGPRHHHAN